MSAQFGKCNFDGKPVDPQELDRVRPVLAPYGPDAEGIFRKGNVGIIYREFHTTKGSRLEKQPYVSQSGAVITWDGRLDNRDDLIREFGSAFSNDSTDVLIVAMAYDRWGTDAFARLIGDWAMSVWDPSSQSLALAKDFLGARHIYYSFDKDQVTWSTIVDPLVLFAGKTFALCEEYIAGWFSFFPAVHLTPYAGIHSVPPASFVSYPGKHKIKKYWDFDPDKTIRYRTDGEYEEHFRTAFAETVRRRLRSDSPVLAELSGGMDSSSIVSIADAILGAGGTESPRLDTISYFNDSEPNWNERPYFTKVEEIRGRVGTHIETGALDDFRLDCDKGRLAALPGDLTFQSQSRAEVSTSMTAGGNRVLLSGFGGDEVTGGVPTPIPELADLLARVRLRMLGRQLTIWALNKRKPWFSLLFESATFFLPPSLGDMTTEKNPAQWLSRSFLKRQQRAISGYRSRVKLLGALPSFQESLSTLDLLRRQIASLPSPSEPPYEKRYPYLDRDFLEFLYAVPREQLLRPGQRRSLMRRALVGVVPEEILNRKRKAYVTRMPLTLLSAHWNDFFAMTDQMISGSLGIVEPRALREAMQKGRNGIGVPIITLIRTLMIECWLRHVQEHKVLSGAAPMAGQTPDASSTRYGDEQDFSWLRTKLH